MSGPYRVVFYRNERGRSRFEDWLRRIERDDVKLWAQVVWLLKLLERYGEDLKAPYVKWNFHGPVSELRKRYRHHYFRIYFWRKGETIYVVAAGELKKYGEPDDTLLAYAIEAYRREAEK